MYRQRDMQPMPQHPAAPARRPGISAVVDPGDRLITYGVCATDRPSQVVRRPEGAASMVARERPGTPIGGAGVLIQCGAPPARKRLRRDRGVASTCRPSIGGFVCGVRRPPLVARRARTAALDCGGAACRSRKRGPQSAIDLVLRPLAGPCSGPLRSRFEAPPSFSLHRRRRARPVLGPHPAWRTGPGPTILLPSNHHDRGAT